jgi:glycogen(starch) synthase
MARVTRQHGDVVLVLVGDGPSREALRAAARAALGERVRWIDRVTQAELPLLYAGAAVSVLPSMFEIYGLAALESMYFGTPVIASRVGGLIDLLGGDSGGVLVDSYDPSAWAAAIGGVLSRGEDERKNAARAARARAEDLTWNALGDRYALFYARYARAS